MNQVAAEHSSPTVGGYPVTLLSEKKGGQPRSREKGLRYSRQHAQTRGCPAQQSGNLSTTGPLPLAQPPWSAAGPSPQSSR